MSLFLLFLFLCAAVSAHADLKVDCQQDFLSVVWTVHRPQVSPSFLRLGNCFPSSLSETEAVFKVELNDCGSVRVVSGDHIVYRNNLTYDPPAEALVQGFTTPVVCQFHRPKDWYRQLYDPVLDTYAQGGLLFHIGLMNKDFSGPAESTAFPLGSIIPIVASVEQRSHQPLLLLLEECAATNTPELSPGSSMHVVITNNGCFIDGIMSRSKFEQRQKSSEIRMSLQAFRFAQGQEIFLHCKLVAWDPSNLDNTRKACNYNPEHGWELLDNPVLSHLCSCCDSSCSSRKTRSPLKDEHKITRTAVLGPLTIIDENSLNSF